MTHRWKQNRAMLLGSISPVAFVFAMAAPLTLAGPASVRAADTDVSEIVVTATRRDTTVQEAPINIAVVSGDAIAEQGLGDLRQVSNWVPGVHIVDGGGRGDSLIVVRGLNANPLGAAEALANDGGGTVATYLGDIPLHLDMKLNDIQRVEFLLGPQGTLYGAGTLGGAVRYIPNRPQFDARSLQVRADGYGYTHGSGISYNPGFTVNLPVTDTFALRASVDYLKDQGFIDYPLVVNEIGVSDPDPDFSNPSDVAANLHRVRDANYEQTWSGRVAARWRPSSKLDFNLTYYFQNQDVGGRQISSSGSTVPVGKWESGLRVLEPNDRKNQLIAFEATADLGFAELTSATGQSWYQEHGHRDQTDLLITLEYSYEAFPSFTAFTTEDENDRAFTQEVRLVSKTPGPFSWIVGGFYDRARTDGTSREFTPHYDAFVGGSRPDALEYISEGRSWLTEAAGFGELSYKLTDAWQVTGGGRYYYYDLKTALATDTPLFNTIGFGAPPDAIDLTFHSGGQSDNGFLFKVNTSYKFSPDALVYATVSEGYRIGNTNGIPLCPNPLPPGQNICAQPNELQYTPDKTINYEVGAHTQWFGGRLTLNGDLYYIKWKDPQLFSATLIGLQPITINGEGARTQGVELSFNARVTPQFTLRGSYAYTDSELTALAPNLIPMINPPGYQSTVTYVDGQAGDRLPGSPKHQGSLYGVYRTQLGEGDISFAYGVTAQGDVLTRTGGRGGGITLPSYAIQDASVTYQQDGWSMTLYAKNLFDKFAQTGARQTPAYNQILTDSGGGLVHERSYFTYVLPPRRVGVRFAKTFGG